jgi:transcriptional regulator with XRE-family HTH domain
MAEKHTPEDILMAKRARAWVKKEQAELRLSQNAMARKLGLKSATLSRYMTSNRLPPIGLILRIRDRLHVDAKLLLDTDPVPSRRLSEESSTSSQPAGTEHSA